MLHPQPAAESLGHRERNGDVTPSQERKRARHRSPQEDDAQPLASFFATCCANSTPAYLGGEPYLSPRTATDMASEFVLLPQTTELPQTTLKPLAVLFPQTTEFPQTT